MIYSQRIASVRALDGVDADTVDRLHEDGEQLAHMRAVPVSPACHSGRMGSQLPAFRWQRSAACAAVDTRDADTSCR
ncbi:hypothetical protein CF641_38440, partial [Burkholderia pseudomallei]|uniref:hypothetical protein n=1 Tax=Burkholderia pseudomallei TaxID=28450 RepID=UPI000CCE90EA